MVSSEADTSQTEIADENKRDGTCDTDLHTPSSQQSLPV